MEEPKERVFSEELREAGVCLSTHAKWQKGLPLHGASETTQGTWHGPGCQRNRATGGGFMSDSSEEERLWLGPLPATRGRR